MKNIHGFKERLDKWLEVYYIKVCQRKSIRIRKFLELNLFGCQEDINHASPVLSPLKASALAIVVEELPGYKDPQSKPVQWFSRTSFLHSPLSDQFKMCTIATFRPGAKSSTRGIFYLPRTLSKAPCIQQLHCAFKYAVEGIELFSL